MFVQILVTIMVWILFFIDFYPVLTGSEPGCLACFCSSPTGESTRDRGLGFVGRGL